MSCEQLELSVEQNVVSTCLEIQAKHECVTLEPQLIETCDIVSRGPQGPQGEPGEGTNVEVTAAENIPAFTMITATGFIANSANLAHYAKVVGMVEDATSTGFNALATVDTELTNPAWSWSPGAQIYLNGTSLSATPPSSGFSQRVAVARTATTIIMGLQPPILL